MFRNVGLPMVVGVLLLLDVAVAQQPGPGGDTDRLNAEIHAKAVAALEADPGLTRNPFAVLVRFEPGADGDQRTAARAAAEATTVRRYSIVPGLELVRTDLPPEAAVAILRAMPGVAYAETDDVLHATDDPPQNLPDDPYRWYEWGLQNDGQNLTGTPGTPGVDINAPEAWWLVTGDPAMVVAVIDAGTEYTHPDLAANIWLNAGEIPDNGIDDDGNGYVDDVRGWDFYGQDNDPMDENGHGTHTAGTIGAVGNNGIGMTGVLWTCRLMPLRFLGPTGSGYMSDAALAIEYAVAKGVKVSNNSYGYSTGAVNQTLYNAIDAAKSIGHIFVAAAGNAGHNIDGNHKSYPAAFDLDNIVTVAATDDDDALAAFSNYGAQNVDLGAPGVAIASTFLSGDYVWGENGWYAWNSDGATYAWGSGTSMAAPHVAGVVALVCIQHPDWTYQQVRAQVIGTARPVAALTNKTVSGGVVDAAAALGIAVPPPLLPPAAPGTPLLSKIGGGQVQIAWADNSTDEDGFEVQREKKSGGSWIDPQIVADVGTDVTAVIDVPGSGTFHYRVRAHNASGDSAWSAWAQIKN